MTLDLTIVPLAAGTDVQTACNSFVWIDGNIYTSDNNFSTYTLVGAAANGCDSIVTLNLTINNVDITTSVTNNVISASAAGASYQWFDCDNGMVELSGEIGSTFTPLANGNYAVVVTENSCSDTSNCVLISTIGVQENIAGNVFSVYPNPTDGKIVVNFSELQGEISAKLYSTEGKLLQNIQQMNCVSFEMKIHQPTGAYLLELTNGNGESSNVKILKK